jgi:hypothetical protein
MRQFFIVFGLAIGVFSGWASAVGAAPATLTIKNHKFAPAEIHVKANEPSQFMLVNSDATAEEFDSASLKVEKVVAGNAQGVVRLRPLAPGRYPFMGEYHADTAQGVVVAE